VKPRSDNRARQERDYTVMRGQFLADHATCDVCHRQATEVHHVRGRSGWRLLYTPWWLALCSDCHRRITEHPAEAVAAGLSASRHGAA